MAGVGGLPEPRHAATLSELFVLRLPPRAGRANDVCASGAGSPTFRVPQMGWAGLRHRRLGMLEQFVEEKRARTVTG